MKNYKLLQNILVILIMVLFGTGVCFAAAASPSTPEEKKQAEKDSKAEKTKKAIEKAPLELSEPMVVSPGDEEKVEETAKSANSGETTQELKEGEPQEAGQEEQAGQPKLEKEVPVQESLPAASRKK
ncbi:MAG: hypothetical protein PHY94_01680 [Candidatus Omnitrophica bacterium]|nr:hypothetical protein [Candidatus Omnitrophota bacterium]